MPTDPQQLARVTTMQSDLEQLLGLDSDSEIAVTENHDEGFALVLTEDAAKRVVEMLRAGKAAPDLYAALESLPCTVRDEVDAAIAKARGES